MVEKYIVVVLLKSTKFQGKYAWGCMSVYKNLKTNEIKRVKGIGKFIESGNRDEMMESYRMHKMNNKVDIVISSIKDLHNDFVYYPIIGNKDEHRICEGYLDTYDNIKYTGTTLQSPKGGSGIWVDDTKDIVKYRFLYDESKMVTYGIAFCIDAVSRSRTKELLRVLKEDV